MVEESFRCYGLYTAETIPTALGCQWGPVGHLLFGIEVFLEYHPLLDLWKKMTHKNVIENNVINPIIHFSTT